MFRYALQMLGLAAVYGVAGVLGLQFAQTQANTTLLWLPSGIALSAVLLWGPRCWPGITLGALLACALVPTAPWAAPVIAVGNTLEAVAGAWLLRRGGFQPQLQRVRDVVLLVVAAALASTTISATARVTAIWLTQPPKGVDYTTVWLLWWLGDALGDLVMAPLLLTWLTPSAWPRSRLAEAGIGLGLLVLLGGCLFGGWLSRGQEWTTSYLAFPFLIWAALRLGPRGAATATFLLTLLAVGGTARGVGPFAGRPLEQGLFLLQTFMGVAAGTALLLAAVLAERRRAEDALAKSEALYRPIVENQTEFIVRWRPDGTRTFVNDSYCRYFGLTAEQCLGTSFFPLVAPEDRDMIRRKIAALSPEHPTASDEHRVLCPDGQVRWNQWTDRGIFDAAGRLVELQSVGRDITDRKRAELALQESERRYRTLVEHAPEAIVILDADSGRFIDANENAVRLYGLERDQLLQVGPFELSPPTQPDGRDSRAAGMDFIRRALAGAVPVFEWVHRNAAGDDIPCEVRLVRLPAEGRRLIRGSVSDIRARKQLEERLRQAERLQSIGQLAGGVAHDFNNLLTIINGYTDLLLEQVAPDHPWHSFVEEVRKAGERAAALTRQLLAFGRRQFLQPVVLDLNRAVTQLEDLLRRLIGARIQLVTELDPALQPIRADRSQIEQVLLNLVVNARDAMPQGGRLTIATANVILGEADVLARPEIRPGAYVRLTVSDTGCGMTPQTRARIFEPFFTTKEIGKGTGLGLATVYGIVKQSGGHIEFTSELGRGTSFLIDLPAVAQPLDPAEPLPDLADLPRGSETILLVEDEAAVRLLARRVLQQSGYVVLDAPDGPAALQLVARHEGPIHLLVTDVVMPEMSGPELVHRLHSARPEIKVLYISGYTETTLGQHSVAAEVRLLKKPFPPIDLVRAVREVLDGSPSDRYQI